MQPFYADKDTLRMFLRQCIPQKISLRFHIKGFCRLGSILSTDFNMFQLEGTTKTEEINRQHLTVDLEADPPAGVVPGLGMEQGHVLAVQERREVVLHHGLGSP